MDFTYISIPRTGTNSIHKALGTDLSQNHLSLNKIESPGFSFAFVRNPYEIVVSWYFYHKLTQGQDTYDIDFLEWVKRGCPTHWAQSLLNSQGITHPLNQFEYVTNKEGVVICDFIGKFETLNKDFQYVCNIIGKKAIKLPHINGSQHQAWESYYTPKALALVKAQFKKDFELFNY